MPIVCLVEKVQIRLHEWGMGDIKVRRMGGKSFILTVEDTYFYKMLEDLQWSYLKEVFSSVRPWSESELKIHRATWIEISGVPIHCWNGTTFRRLAQLWGEFNAFGENLDCSIDCEKMKVLITTSRVQKICEVVELENKGSLSKQVSPSLLESSRSEGLIEEDTHQARAGKEALSEDNLGKQTNHDIVDADMGKESDLAARELMGEKPARTAADTAKSKNGNNIVKGDIKNDKENVNWANLLFKNKLAREQTGVGLRTSRNDVGEMGLVNLVKGPSRTKEGVVDKLSLNPNQGINSESDTSPISGHKEKEDRGVGINPLSSIGKSLDAELEKVEDWSSASEEEESLSRAERVFFPELDSKKVNKKRYGPLMQIQEMRWGLKPFKLINGWLQIEDCREKIEVFF
ncbi:hypothetical protein V6N13_112296 [Hibiscus sabdariffa]